MNYCKKLILPVIFGIIGMCAMFAGITWLVLVAAGLLEISLCRVVIEFILTKVEPKKSLIGYWSIPAALLIISLWCFFEALSLLFTLTIPLWFHIAAVTIGTIVLVWFFAFCFIVIISSIIETCRKKK